MGRTDKIQLVSYAILALPGQNMRNPKSCTFLCCFSHAPDVILIVSYFLLPVQEN